jgi:hypothetical protein
MAVGERIYRRVSQLSRDNQSVPEPKVEHKYFVFVGRDLSQS